MLGFGPRACGICGPARRDVMHRAVNPPAVGVVNQGWEWIATNYGGPKPRRADGRTVGTRPRTVAGRFRVATGHAPIEQVQAIRVEEAKQIVEADDVEIDRAGERVGYEDPASCRRVFKRLVRLTPSNFRRKFQRFAGRMAPS